MSQLHIYHNRFIKNSNIFYFSIPFSVQYKLDFSGLANRAASGSSRDEDGVSGLQEGKGTSTGTEGSM